MTPVEFTTVVMPTKLIPADEALEIFSYLNGDDLTRFVRFVKWNHGEHNKCNYGNCDFLQGRTHEYFQSTTLPAGVESWLRCLISMRLTTVMKVMNLRSRYGVKEQRLW